MFVMLFDPPRRPESADPVGALQGALSGLSLVLGPERTLGDSAIAIAERAGGAVGAVCRAREAGGWRIGVGVGALEHPLPQEARAVRGPALEAATAALRAASTTSQVPLAIRAADPRHAPTAQQAEAVLRLIGWMITTRSAGQWRVVRELRAHPGLAQRELAARLGVTQQTVSRAIATSGWREESAAHPLLADLLAMIDLTSGR